MGIKSSYPQFARPYSASISECSTKSRKKPQMRASIFVWRLNQFSNALELPFNVFLISQEMRIILQRSQNKIPQTSITNIFKMIRSTYFNLLIFNKNEHRLVKGERKIFLSRKRMMIHDST